MEHMKETVVVSRNWKNPEIKIAVCTEDIKISMPLDEFLKALALEAGNPTFVVTVKGLEKRLQSAALTVAEGMKKETERVV